MPTSHPTRIGRWKIVDRLGSGGMGTVYLGVDGDEQAAIKVVAPALADDPAFRSRFRREVEICRRVSGRQVAPLIDAGPDDAIPWLAVQYIPGPTLQETIQTEGPLTGEALRGFALASAEALHQIHAAGVVHRDLKPSNVILTPSTPVIIDFGIAGASEATALTATGTVLGSAGWMAPEQVLGQPVGPPADVFAWGALVAFAASGRPPFGEGRPEALAYRIVHGEADLGGLEGPIRSLVSMALKQDPAQRPEVESLLSVLASGNDSGTAIAASWADSPTAIGTNLWVAPPMANGVQTTRRRSLVWPAAAATVAIFIGITALLVSNRSPADGTVDLASAVAEDTTTTTMLRSTTTESAATVPQTTITAPPPPTTEPQAPSIRDVDLYNRSYDINCDGEGISTIDLVDGSWTSPAGPMRGAVGGIDASYHDVDGDGIEDSIVNINCSIGAGSNNWTTAVMLRPTTDGAEPIGQPIPSRIKVVDGKLMGESYQHADGDPMCCPSLVQQSEWTLRGGGWSQGNIHVLPIAESFWRDE